MYFLSPSRVAEALQLVFAEFLNCRRRISRAWKLGLSPEFCRTFVVLQAFLQLALYYVNLWLRNPGLGNPGFSTWYYTLLYIIHFYTFPYKERGFLGMLGRVLGAEGGGCDLWNPGFPVSKPGVSQSQVKRSAKPLCRTPKVPQTSGEPLGARTRLLRTGFFPSKLAFAD